MKARNRVLPALLLSLFAAAAAPSAGAAQFSNVVVFGDSLSDAGYYRPFLASLGLPAPRWSPRSAASPPTPARCGRRSSPSSTASRPRPSNANGGNDLRPGRSPRGEPSASTPPGSAQRPVSTQINEYLGAQRRGRSRTRSTRCGPAPTTSSRTSPCCRPAAITSDRCRTTCSARPPRRSGRSRACRPPGARYIIVCGLPNIGATPAFAGSAATATSGSVTAALRGLQHHALHRPGSAGIRVIPVDAFSLLAEIRANPSAYGFTNVTALACGPFPPITTASTISAQFCGPTNLVAPDAAQTYLFADSVHPTAAAQAIVRAVRRIADRGPDAISLLAETPLATRASHAHTINNGLLTARDAPVGKLKVFAAGSAAASSTSTPAPATPASNSDLSRDERRPHDARLGNVDASGSRTARTAGDGASAPDAGSYNTREDVSLLFGALHWGGFYGTGILSIANIDFRDMRRNVVLGPGGAHRQLRAPTAPTARPSSTRATISTIGRLTIGPTVSVNARRT